MHTSRTKLRELISKDIVWADPTDSLEAIAQSLASSGASSVLVSKNGSTTDLPQGIFTLRDLVNVMHRGISNATPISEVMSKPVIAVDEHESFEDALGSLLKYGVRHLVVVDEQRQVLGLVAESDFKKYQQLSVISGFINIKNLINTNVVTLSRDALLEDAINFLDHGVSSFVVVCDEERPIGILSEAEIARCFTRASAKNKVFLDEVMTPPELFSIDHSAVDIIEKLVSIESECLVLVDAQGYFSGVLTLHNLLQPIQHLYLNNEKSRLESALKEVDKRWLMALDGAGHGVWDWDTRLGTVYLSDQWKRNIGFAKDEFESSFDAWINRIHPDDIERVKQEMQAHSQTSIDEFETVYRIAHKDGSYRWMQDRGMVFQRRQDGYPLRVVGTQTDITELQESLRTLEVSEAYQRSLIESFPFPVWLKNLQGEILASNRAVLQQSAKKIDIWSYLDAATLGLIERQSLQGEKSSYQELTVADKSQKAPIWLETFSTPVLQQSGALLGSVGFARDITELHAAKETFAAAFELSPIPMVLSDSETLRYLDVNKAFQERSGYTKEDIVGKPVFEPDFFDSIEERDRLANALRTEGKVYNYEVQLRDKERRLRYCLFSSELMQLGSQTVRLTVVQDLTEHLQIESELRAERDLFTDGPVCVLIWRPNINWDIQYVSRNAERVLGYTAEQLTSTMCYADCIHPDDIDRVRTEVRDFYAGDKVRWEQRYRVIKQNGDIVWIYDFTQADRDEAGKVVLLRGYIIDESQRVKSEEAVRLSAKVFDHAHEGIMITGANQVVLDVNPTFTEITGFTREEMVGRTPSLLRSGYQTESFYNDLWQQLAQGGYWRGEIKNRHKDGSLYTALMTISAVYDTTQKLTHYISVFSDISQLKEHQLKLERLAHFDALTQLPNRVLFSERLNQLMAITKRQKRNMAVCYLDLDHFKPVNDEMGHDVGDSLLIEVSRRLKSVLRDEDTVARLGGDEFAILLADLNSIEECDITLQRILYSIAEPFEIKQRMFIISASIGVAWFPEDMADADSLIRHADQAMYQAKMSGRNRYHIYDARSEVQSRTHLNTLKSISEGLESGQFELFYQPQVNLREGAVLGVEALIRWNHPTKGLLAPAYFLPKIADCDTAVELDHWVLNASLQALRHWQSQGLYINVSINLSGRTLLRPDFIPHIVELMKNYSDISPMYIELEVLETTALEDINQAETVFAECQRMGFSIALDDFGTGYSSLTYFRRLPVNTLKIDQSFIRDMLDDPEDMAIVESVIGLGKAFNRHLVAEGVESIAHGQALMDMGCNIAQGYGIAKPMRFAEVSSWVKGWTAKEFEVMGELAVVPLEHRALIAAELEHSRWIERIADYIDNDYSVKARPDSMDEHICRFGRWYYGYGRNNFETLPAFRKIEPCHAAIHQLASILIQLCKEGDRGQAKRRLGELLSLSTQLHELLEQLRQQIGNC